MPDYIYLLENRLSADQQHALREVREVAREAGHILFLTGSAVRDLTSGYAVRDLEVAIQGNALKLKKQLAKHGGELWGEDELSRTLYLSFPGKVRVDLVSTTSVEYPKPGKPVFHPGSIHEFLRTRDFTVNSMALSLNEGSYGLLMDPLNGVADIESRTLRLASAYGFLEEPALLIRSTRYKTRLGWEFDEKTRTRFENAMEEGVLEHLTAQKRGQELEEIMHAEDGLRTLRAHEAAGWMKILFPGWTAAKADEKKLNDLHDLAVRFELQGVKADLSAAQAQLLTAKLGSREISGIKKLFPREGFVQQWNHLDAIAAGFSKVLLAKDKQTPSVSYKLFMSYDPEAILWLGFTSKESGIKQRYERFLTEWPEVRTRIPYALLQEMRITPELPIFKEVVEKLFLAFIDGKLTTPEELKAFIEPYSPPAPPPPVSYKKPRVKRGAGARVKDEGLDDDDVVVARDEDEDDLDDLGADDDLELPEIALDADEADDDDEDEFDDDEPAGPKGLKSSKGQKAEKSDGKGKVAAKSEKVAAAKVVPIAKAGPVAKAASVAKAAPAVKATPVVKHAEPAGKAKVVVPVKKVEAAAKKVAAKPAAKPVAKTAAKAKPVVKAKAVVKSKPVVKAKAKPQVKAKVAAKPKPKPVTKAKPAAKKPVKAKGKKR
jgi:tRNA nucleotidyltransferase (CCA-adding enzyme)